MPPRPRKASAPKLYKDNPMVCRLGTEGAIKKDREEPCGCCVIGTPSLNTGWNDNNTDSARLPVMLHLHSRPDAVLWLFTAARPRRARPYMLSGVDAKGCTCNPRLGKNEVEHQHASPREMRSRDEIVLLLPSLLSLPSPSKPPFTPLSHRMLVPTMVADAPPPNELGPSPVVDGNFYIASLFEYYHTIAGLSPHWIN